MLFKEMQFRGNTVFVEVDDAGAVVVDKSRARMKYRLEDDRIYNPNIANLTAMDDAPIVKANTTAASPAPGKSRSASSSKGRSASPSKATTTSFVFDKDSIVAFTDGACSGNPGPAGLGFTVRFPDGRFVRRGEPLGNATNNIAELTAILRVLEQVEDKDAQLLIHTDSSYSIGVLTAGWKAKANQSLIATILSKLAQFKNVELRKVKGHAGIEDNEMVDRLAREAAETQLPVK